MYQFTSEFILASPGWLSGEQIGLITWWLGVRDPAEGNFLSGVFLPLTTAKACGKGSWLLWKESCVSNDVRKPENTGLCVSDRHNMTLAVEVALKPNTTNQLNLFFINPLIHTFRHIEGKSFREHCGTRGP